MERINYMPLGSIVLLKGALKKLLIISRAINVRNSEKILFFDYAAVPYPEGLINDQVVYFNNEDISKIVFEGYRDIDDENAVDNINRYLAEHPDLEKGNTEKWVEE